MNSYRITGRSLSAGTAANEVIEYVQAGSVSARAVRDAQEMVLRQASRRVGRDDIRVTVERVVARRSLPRQRARV